MLEPKDKYLRWYPWRAKESTRWRQLTPEEKGYFHELYDLSADEAPYGEITLNGKPMTIEQLQKHFGGFGAKIGTILAQLEALGLIIYNDAGGVVFPDFGRHQRGGHFRPRHKTGALIGADLGTGLSHAPDTVTVIAFDFRDNMFTGITDEYLRRWRKAYPIVDVEVEILRAAEWLIANPNKRKKNYHRFLTNWFSRNQERGGGKPSNKPHRQSGSHQQAV